MTANASKTTEKFLFDTSFESAKSRAAMMDRPQPKYSEADLEKARAEGSAAGHAAAKREAAQSIEHAAAQAANAIAERLGALEQALAAAGESQARMAVELSAALVRKMMPSMTERHGLAEIEGLVIAAMERLREEPRIVIRVADGVLDTVQATVAAVAQRAGFDGKVVLLAEPGLAPGDARVEWADGGAERDAERAWRDVEALIQKVVGIHQGQTTPEQTPTRELPKASIGVTVSA